MKDRRLPIAAARTLILFLLAGLFLASGLGAAEPPAAGAGEDAPRAPLGKREVRAALHEADTALSAGHLDRAASLYDQVLAGVAAGDERRADALFGRALTERLRAPEERDVARAAALLRELSTSYPRDPRHQETVAALADLDHLAQALASARHLAERVAELQAKVEEQEAKDAQMAEARADAGRRVADLEADAAKAQGEIARLRERLAAVEAELQKKDEALQKVKATLVGG